jgi:hypothetical protein
MNKFISDMLHMTEGEKLISYWWLWLILCIPILVIYYVVARKLKGGK